MKIGFSLLIIALLSAAAVPVLAQSPPTLRIVTETPGLPSELFYGNIKVKPVRLRPGTNQAITITTSISSYSSNISTFWAACQIRPVLRTGLRR